MNPIKIIFFDIDGTLVDPATRKISDKTREALQCLRRNGVLLCVATGRPTASLPDFGDVHFDAFCTFNGCLCYTKEKIIHATPISKEDVDQVLQNAEALELPVSLAVQDRLAANGVGEDLAEYYLLADLTLTVSEDFLEATKEDVYQIMIGCGEEAHPALIQGTKGVKLAISWDRAVDIIPAAGGKGASVLEILKFFHLEPSQAMAFGDSYNDLEMLQAVGTGVAMGNAADALKAVADDVCGRVDEEGIYHYCLDHGLI